MAYHLKIEFYRGSHPYAKNIFSTAYIIELLPEKSWWLLPCVLLLLDFQDPTECRTKQPRRDFWDTAVESGQLVSF
jgi:hypothetical protein